MFCTFSYILHKDAQVTRAQYFISNGVIHKNVRILPVSKYHRSCELDNGYYTYAILRYILILFGFIL